MTLEKRAESAALSGIDATVSLERRYDVDWLRTLAMGFLIIYHVMISFQPWGHYIGFPENADSIEWIWIFMAMLNIWRIPILFMVSGMGVRFAMERRNWKQLLGDRALRILLPYVFGIWGLGGIVAAILPRFGWNADYTLHFGHLWFLGNIFMYLLWVLYWFVSMKKHPDNALLRFCAKWIRRPFGLYIFAIPIMIESTLTNPQFFSMFVDNAHGLVMGFLCFFMGFIFVSLRDVFWPAVKKLRWSALGIGFGLYLVRLFVFQLEGEPHAIVAIESWSWMLAVLGFGAMHLNEPSRSLSYLSKAVYPVYIVHMPVQFLIAYHLLPMQISAYAKLGILLFGTFASSFILFEILRRIKWIGPLFGMK